LPPNEKSGPGFFRPHPFFATEPNQVISKRMVKKQQMRWTQRGAHLLLQIRTKALNNELEEVFRIPSATAH
jgi:hypothetical protein